MGIISTTYMMDICTICTETMLTSMSLRFQKKTLIIVHQITSVLVMMLTMFTVPVADMKLCLMGITLTIWWTVAYIIHTMGTAMIMVL